MPTIMNRICKLVPNLSKQRSLIEQIQTDLYREDQGTTIHFPLDFFEIHNYLFPVSHNEEDTRVVKYYFENLNHKMVLLPPSAWEMIQHLRRQSMWLQQINHPSAQFIDEFLNSQELREFCEKLETVASPDQIELAYNKMGKYKKIINFLREGAVKTILEEPAQLFVDSLDTGRLVEVEAIVGDNVWQELDDNVFNQALNAFEEKRPAIEKNIPNRTDSLNLAMTLALNNLHYTTRSGGEFFVIVTHSSVTQSIYSTIQWQNDPLYPNGTCLNRNHRYCAYHAYFDKCPDPKQAVKKYLNELVEIDALQEQFETLFQRYGREYLEKLLTSDGGVRKELERIYAELEQMQNQLAIVTEATQLEHEEWSWGDIGDLLDKVKSKQQIKDILREHIKAANNAIKAVFERVEPMVSSPSIRIIDRGFEKVISFIKTPSDIMLPPEDEEHLILKAFFKKQSGDRPFDLNREYTLCVEAEWRRPKNIAGPNDFTFEVIVEAQDMDISSSAIDKLVALPNSKPTRREFKVTPRSIGTQKIRIGFNYRLNRICQIELEARVIGNEEPPYIDLYESTVHEKLQIHRPTSIEKVTVQITINPSKGGYEGYIHRDGSYSPMTISVTPHDAHDLNTQLQQAAARLSLCITGNGTVSEEFDTALQELAEEGKHAYNLLFDKKTQTFLSGALQDKHAKPIIQITSDDLVLPWDLLFDQDPRAPSVGQFWGMRYIIWRNVTCRHDSSFVSPRIKYSAKPTVGLVTDVSLDAVKNQEIPFFENLVHDGKISLISLRPLDPQKDAIEEFLDFWQTEFCLAHFACHAVTEMGGRSSSYLIVSNDYKIYCNKLIALSLWLNNYPLVILNACHTGAVDTLYSQDLARTFLRCGALGVLATECPMPDFLAPNFTKALYYFLLRGLTLGESLLYARWLLWNMFRNPTGLLYSMYAPEAIRLVEES